MKKILSMVAAVAILSSVASAELLKNFKHTGSLEVNAYNVNNADFNKNIDDKYGDVDTRLMLDMSFDLNDDASAVVSVVKNNRQWGTAQEDANTIQTNLVFEQAYLNLKGVMGMDHKLGRQYYGKEGDMVIYFGPQRWPYMPVMPVSALDAWVGTYKYNDWTFTGLLGKIPDIITDDATGTDATGTMEENLSMGKNLSGIDVKTKIDRFDLNAYYYNYSDNDNTTVGRLGVAGLRANWECMFLKDLNLRLEYDKNFGSDKSYAQYKGYAYKLNADYKMDLAGKMGFMAEYTYMSGQDTSTDNKVYTPINIDYRPGIIANGYGVNSAYVTAVGTGYKGMHFGANWTPSAMEKLNIAATYYNMKVAEKNTGMKDTLGNEIDLVATWKHSDNVSVKGYYAMFKPEKDNSGTDDAQTALGAAFVLKF